MQITTVRANTFEILARKIELGGYDFVSIHGDCTLIDTGYRAVDGAMLHGASSCLGAMTEGGAQSGLAAFCISDPAGAYGTGVCAFGPESPRSAARNAVQEALRSAGRVAERPEIVWISATPGDEEDVICGIEDVIGSDVPIIGGSAADNTVSGEWSVFDGNQRIGAGVVVSVLFPSRPVSFAYQNGYSPTAKSGVVTEVAGRTVAQIDGRPALDVYSEWTGGAIPAGVSRDGPTTILSDSTLWPLGREVAEYGGVPFYLLSHPAVATFDKGLELFSTVEKGETLTAMTGTVAGLTERAGRVAKLARAKGRMEDAPVLGALLIYCGGCMLTVQDELPDVVAGVNAALDGAPFLGAFTFGEQGTLLGAGNRHGNLMISAIVFG